MCYMLFAANVDAFVDVFYDKITTQTFRNMHNRLCVVPTIIVQKVRISDKILNDLLFGYELNVI